MIRITVLSLFVFFLAAYARKDWFKSLCGLIVLTAVLEHPDMPKQIMGIPGLNLWNILFLSICLAWARAIRLEDLKWDMPPLINRLLVFYVVIVVVGVTRLIFDHSGVVEFRTMMDMPRPSVLNYVNDYIVNTIKFAVPGILIFSGCRSKSRVHWAATSIVIMYVILALLTIKAVKFDVFTLSGDELQSRAHKVVADNVGFHRVNLSMMFSGAAWALFAYREMIEDKRTRLLLVFLSGVVVLAMASTGGRMGYLTWGALLMALIMLRWRKLVLAIPVAAVGVLVFMPSVIDRMSFGLSEEEDTSSPRYVVEGELGLYQMTSGRILAWPLVVDKIGEAPIIGHGRDAMINSGVTKETYLRFGPHDTFAHPHNGYLQWLLDNGFLGFIGIMLFYLTVIRYSIKLLRHSDDSMIVAIGGMSFCLVGALLIASMGSQSFYPREGSVGMWCAIGLMLRVYVERMKLIKYQETT